MRRLVVCLLLMSATAFADGKDPKVAKALSGGGAAVSGAVVLAGFLTAPEDQPFNAPIMYTGIGMLLVTPSLGEVYAGEYLTLGMGIRAAAAGLAIYATQTQTHLVQCEHATSSNDPPCETFSENAWPLLGVAAIGFVGGVWWDALGAGEAVDRYNREHGISVMPSAQPTAQGFTAGLSGTF